MISTHNAPHYITRAQHIKLLLTVGPADELAERAGRADRRLSQVSGQDTAVCCAEAGGEKAGTEREGERKGERMLGQSESVQ